MDTVFPFGLPETTALYLALYVATFALHQALMHYVLAGSLYVAWATIFPGSRDTPRAAQPLASTLRDWMPFLLGAAITAGVAPLLFIQIVYPRHFYTANVLLAWRWMAVIPVLIFAFYLLYLIKSSAISKWPYLLRSAVVLAAAVSFVFVGFCWTANHLLAGSEGAWSTVYVTGQLPFTATEVCLRMSVWAGAAFGTMSAVVAWQLTPLRAGGGEASGPAQIRRLATMSLGGLSLAVVAGVYYIAESSGEVRKYLFGPLLLPYLLAALLGVLLQMGGWGAQLRAAALRPAPLLMVSVGVVLALAGASVVREGLRLSRLDIETLAARHAAAGAVGGRAVFLAFAALNLLLIVACVLVVRRGTARTQQAGEGRDAGV